MPTSENPIPPSKMKTQSRWTTALFAGLTAALAFGPSFAAAQNNNGSDAPEPAPIPRRMKPDKDPNRQRDTTNESDRRSMNSFTQGFPKEYRTIDGFGNNQAEPRWGSAEIPYLRLTLVDYLDGLEEPSGSTRPNAREISNEVATQTQSTPNRRRATDFVWQWGQFLDHDLDETPAADPEEKFDIEVPTGDPLFDPQGTGDQVIPLNRSAYIEDKNGVRHQINAITAYIDASNVYGSDQERADELRLNDGSGKLKTSESDHGPLLPFNDAGLDNAGGPSPKLFLAGDVRANEQVALTSMHTLFVREHNYWAEAIARRDGTLEGDDLYEMARAVVGAEMQAITYREFLPVLLGEHPLPPYQGYNPSVDAGIANVFATAAYRFGHSMLNEELLRLERDGDPIREGNLPLAQAFFSPQEVIDIGIEPYLRGLTAQPAQEVDTRLVDAVRNFLFGPPGSGGFDLAALNIQRGRDHGLPGYNEVRANFGLPRLDDFADFVGFEPGIEQVLEQLYGEVDLIDPWVGMLAEDHVRGAMVGETLQTLLRHQFIRLRDGDRFWYQNVLSEDLQKLVERQHLSDVIERNTRIGREIPENVFLLERGNKLQEENAPEDEVDKPRRPGATPQQQQPPPPPRPPRPPRGGRR